MKTVVINRNSLFDFLCFNSFIINTKPRIAKFKNEGINKQKIKSGLKTIFCILVFFFRCKNEMQYAKIITANIDEKMENLPKDILNKSEMFNSNETACTA